MFSVFLSWTSCHNFLFVGLPLSGREPGLSSCSIWRQASTHLHHTQLTTLIHKTWDKIGIAALGLLKQFYYKGICIRLHGQSQIVPGVCIPNVLLQISVHKASIIWQGPHFCVCYLRGFWRLSAKQSITRITSRLGGWEIICRQKYKNQNWSHSTCWKHWRLSWWKIMLPAFSKCWSIQAKAHQYEI